MELDIKETRKLGVEVFEASIKWNGREWTEVHMSWDGAYNWLSRTAKKIAREYKNPT